jgi:hypothetical protein
VTPKKHAPSTTAEAGWQLEIFECLAGVDAPSASVCKIGGWVKEPFAMDRRYFHAQAADEAHSGWVITHLPTGYCLFGVLGGKNLAFDIADELSAACDWYFVDADVAKDRAPAVRAIMKRHPEIRNPALFDKALWLDGGRS